MSYAEMDHADWMERTNASIRRRNPKKAKSIPESLTDFQKKVIDIMGMVGGGIYNAPINHEKIDWNYGGGVSVVWQRELSTWDFSQLSMLVFLCHTARIRCEITGCGPRNIRMSFWQRLESGETAVRHPNLEEAVRGFENYLPKDHRVRFQ